MSDDDLEGFSSDDFGIDPDIASVTRKVQEVMWRGGDVHDLVAELVNEEGEAEALRLLAKAQLSMARTIRRQIDFRDAAEGTGAMQGSRCPVCDEPCEECSAEAYALIQEALPPMPGES